MVAEKLFSDILPPVLMGLTTCLRMQNVMLQGSEDLSGIHRVYINYRTFR